MKKILNYIDGQLVEPSSKKYIDNFNPALAEVYSQIPRSNREDVQKAVEAAKMAFPSWSTTPKANRSAILRKIAELIRKNKPYLAEAESIDNGKPLSLAHKVDIPRASENFQFFSSAILHFESET